MTDDEIRQSLEICEAASPPELWKAERSLFIKDDGCKDLTFVLHARTALPAALAELQEARAEVSRLRDALIRNDGAISQTLGKALGYPKYADDQKNFPGATGDDVCVGDHVAESLACEAAEKLQEARGKLTAVRELLERILPVGHYDWPELRQLLELEREPSRE